MVEEKKTRTTKEPKVQDVSKVLEDATRTIMELDSRLENMRCDLDGLTQSAGLAASGVSASRPSQPVGTYRTEGVGWAGVGGFGPAWSTPGQPPAQAQPFLQGGFQGLTGQRAAWSARLLRQQPPTTREPQVDIIDAGSEFVIQMEVPGVRKDDLDIMATDKGLIITGEYRPELDDEGVVIVIERGPIAYRRTVELPSGIQTSECKATLKDGLLTLRVPKKSPSDGAHHVNIAYS